MKRNIGMSIPFHLMPHAGKLNGFFRTMMIAPCAIHAVMIPGGSSFRFEDLDVAHRAKLLANAAAIAAGVHRENFVKPMGFGELQWLAENALKCPAAEQTKVAFHLSRLPIGYYPGDSLYLQRFPSIEFLVRSGLYRRDHRVVPRHPDGEAGIDLDAFPG